MQNRIKEVFDVNSKEHIDYIKTKTSSFLSSYQSLKNFYYWTAVVAVSIASLYLLGFNTLAFLMVGLAVLGYSPLKAIGTRKNFEDNYQNNLHELFMTFRWCIASGAHVLNNADVLGMVEAMVNSIDEACLLPWDFPQELELSEQFKSILANSQHRTKRYALDMPKEETQASALCLFRSGKNKKSEVHPFNPRDFNSRNTQAWEDACRLVNNYLFRYNPPADGDKAEAVSLQTPVSFFKDTIVPNISAAASHMWGYSKP